MNDGYYWILFNDEITVGCRNAAYSKKTPWEIMGCSKLFEEKEIKVVSDEIKYNERR